MSFISSCNPLVSKTRILICALICASTQITSALAQPSGGLAVTFGSQDGADKPVILRGALWSPTDTPRGAIVLVHGSGGWSNFREGHYGRALSAAGYTVLAIDSFGPRGIIQTIEDQSQISPLQMTRDALAARRFLIEKGFSADRLAVMGFSKGGSVALFAADRNFLPQEADRFALAIPFYPGCSARPVTPKPASIIFMVIGEKDNYTTVKPCQDIAADYAQAGDKVTVKLYPDAAHGFDGDPARTGMINLRFAENYSECVFAIEDDGQLQYGGKKYGPYESSIEILRTDLKKTCMKKGAAVWTNTRQKEIATNDVIEFLHTNFPK